MIVAYMTKEEREAYDPSDVADVPMMREPVRKAYLEVIADHGETLKKLAGTPIGAPIRCIKGAFRYCPIEEGQKGY